MIETAVKAALEAGDAILEIYARDFEIEYKADESPLTEADKASHEIIVKALETTPYPVLSEESKTIAYAERRGWSTYWLVDPIDGTKEFIKKNGEFTVNIALVKDGVPVMGVVFVPVEGSLYLGSERGAFKAVKGEHFKRLEELLEKLPNPENFQVLKVSGAPKGPLKVVASKSHCNDETLQFIAELEEEYGAAERVSRGSSLKLCMVAEGVADIYPRIAPTCEWDTAAAHAVVTAAGGRVFEYRDGISAAAYKTGSDSVSDVVYNKENLLNPFFVVSGLN
ncbi:3'(2'),5'-bisphosphate nucleotidase [Verrucomicrobia bacterium S94]|nr:3'(2'),5'-bisphosphate nucleotidase [Verrucomicrobia bacterium S94]